MSLVNWRTRKGWTQRDLAQQLGLSSKSLISGFERGRLKPTTDQAIAIDRLSAGAVPVAELRPDLHDVRVIQPAPHSGASA